MADLSTLARNDVPGAMAVYEAAWKRHNGDVSGDLVETLFMLQDSSDALGDAFEAFHAQHGIE